MPLEPPDKKHWNAAVGYVELGMFQEANDQLENIDPFNRAAPEVLAEQSTRTWSRQALAWSLVLTARAGSVALLGLEPALDRATTAIIPTGITGDRHTTGITGIEFTTVIIIVITTTPIKLA